MWTEKEHLNRNLDTESRVGDGVDWFLISHRHWLHELQRPLVHFLSSSDQRDQQAKGRLEEQLSCLVPQMLSVFHELSNQAVEAT